MANSSKIIPEKFAKIFWTIRKIIMLVNRGVFIGAHHCRRTLCVRVMLAWRCCKCLDEDGGRGGVDVDEVDALQMLPHAELQLSVELHQCDVRCARNHRSRHAEYTCAKQLGRSIQRSRCRAKINSRGWKVARHTAANFQRSVYKFKFGLKFHQNRGFQPQILHLWTNIFL